METTDYETLSDKYLSNGTRIITDDNGRVWVSHIEYMSGSIYWTTPSIPNDTIVYITPYFDGIDGIPICVVNEDGKYLMSNIINIDNNISIDDNMKIALTSIKL